MFVPGTRRAGGGRGSAARTDAVAIADVLEAVEEEAHKLHLPIAHHNGVEETTAWDDIRYGTTSIEHWYGIPDAAIPEGVQNFPSSYNYNNETDRFRYAGKRMAVLSNKPTAMSRHILEGLGVGGHFFRILGGDSFEQKKPHRIGVETLMRESGVDRARTMMVGDSSVDVATARNAGIACCGVAYGVKPESLADPAPDLLVDRMEQFADWLLKK